MKNVNFLKDLWCGSTSCILTGCKASGEQRTGRSPHICQLAVCNSLNRRMWKGRGEERTAFKESSYEDAATSVSKKLLNFLCDTGTKMSLTFLHLVSHMLQVVGVSYPQIHDKKLNSSTSLVSMVK